MDGLLARRQRELADLRVESALFHTALLYPQSCLRALLRFRPAILGERLPLLLFGPGEGVLLRIDLKGEDVDIGTKRQLQVMRGVAAAVELGMRVRVQLALAGKPLDRAVRLQDGRGLLKLRLAACCVIVGAVGPAWLLGLHSI